MKELLEQALNEIENLHIGEKFLVKDLFKGYEWNRLSLNERRDLGRYFCSELTNPLLEQGEIILLNKNNANQQVYQKKFILSGSSGTGEDILHNIESFCYTLNQNLPQENGSIWYYFNWSFYEQSGTANIGVKNHKISDSSLIDTDEKSIHRFGRALGLYNDESLEKIFCEMLKSIKVYTDGIYSEYTA